MKIKKLLASLLTILLVGMYPASVLAIDASPTSTTSKSPGSGAQDAGKDAGNKTPPGPTGIPGPTSDPGPKDTPGNTSTPGPKGTPGNTDTPGPTSTPGPNKPTGADTSTYKFNKDTGMWENDHYIWDPATGQSKPKKDPGYHYDPVTKTWGTDKWVYDAASGKYVDAPEPINPQLAKLLGLIAPVKSTDPSSLTDYDHNSINGTGGNSKNSITNNHGNNGFFDLFSKNEVNNYYDLAALSGKAGVTGNTLAGNAQSGAVAAMANIVNLLNSLWNLTGGKLLLMFRNIFGDVNGDIRLDPDALAAQAGTTGGSSSLGASVTNTGPNSNNSISHNGNDNLTINASTKNSINNNYKINATSGDADVSRNTQAGNATSGAATILLNLINFINSSITSGQSFFAILNIFGNFNGDVLFPPGFIDSILNNTSSQELSPSSGSISGTGPNSNNTIQGNNTNNLAVNNNSSNAINNNINSNAQSGSANVSKNTQAGTATTGTAKTNLTLLNLTGQSIVGKNVILVFVNVLGKWVGLIMNAPAGTHTAVLGGGASIHANTANTGPNSNNTISANDNNSTTLTSNVKNTINNNIDLNAKSGNANVSNNSIAGGATSGDANIASSVLNISFSDLALSNWFGILFINVFGNWFGSVGVDTPAGNPPTPVSPLSGGSHGGPSQAASFIGFTPHQNVAGSSGQDNADGDANNNNQTSLITNSNGPQSPTSVSASHTSGKSSNANPFILMFVFLAVAGGLLIIDHISSRRSHLKLQQK